MPVVKGMSSSSSSKPSSGYGSVNEDLPILLPSSHSTDNPSCSNLADLVQHDGQNSNEHDTRMLLPEEGGKSMQIQLTNFQHQQKFYAGNGSKSLASSKSGGWARYVLLALFLLLLTYGGFHVTHNWYSNSNGGDSSQKTSKTSKASIGLLSPLDPVGDLGLYDYPRPDSSKPTNVLTSGGTGDGQGPYPTNAWYQNLLLLWGEPTDSNRAYTVPYLVDAGGPVPGLRLHPQHISASTTVVQLNIVIEHALTIGAYRDVTTAVTDDNAPYTKMYNVGEATPLGVTLNWDHYPMSSSIVKGMPYATMKYETITSYDESGNLLLPTIASDIDLGTYPIVDQEATNDVQCNGEKFKVDREVQIFFKASDFTWLVFVSEPVFMHCKTDNNGHFKLQVVDWAIPGVADRLLVVRIALLEPCSSGVNPIFCHEENMDTKALLVGQGNYFRLIRSHAHLYPGEHTSFYYDVPDKGSEATLVFDWDVQDMSNERTVFFDSNATNLDLISFALPHHMDMLGDDAATAGDAKYCFGSLTGPACLLEGANWRLLEEIPKVSFKADRPPAPWSIPELAGSLHADINYTLPDYYRRGAGDTYFSGKMLAKLARIVTIAVEVTELCNGTSPEISDDSMLEEYKEACDGISLPVDEIEDAVASLRSSVEVWLTEEAETPFVYDSAWGGVVSCGCWFDEDHCTNEFPNCPGFSDPGLNFGNAWYNDVHFHYGYHIYAAAVVAKFDPSWGRRFFERVLLLIRTFANPTEDDKYFPLWRHKDWYQGHSWASGIATAVPNGRNQESSSEAIAAYEGVALFGAVMEEAWDGISLEKFHGAREVRRSGEMMLATELRSAKRYWHVNHGAPVKIYPAEYTPHVVGIMWQTMAQFQTWFGAAAYLAYGIQLLPLTAISENRDDINWVKGMYQIYAESCYAEAGCRTSGWAVNVIAMLATVGHQELATKEALLLDPRVFLDPGGDGHSLTNTLWYIATRPSTDPLELNEQSNGVHQPTQEPDTTVDMVTDCQNPTHCTDYVLDTIAALYSCRQRIQWLMTERGQSEKDACYDVAAKEFPEICGACNPFGPNETVPEEVANLGPDTDCPPCDFDQCFEFDRCPQFPQTYVCVEGPSRGGCSRIPWNDLFQCQECCESTACQDVLKAGFDPNTTDADDVSCPPCSRDVCRSRDAQECPSASAPFLCTDGYSAGGCSKDPWVLPHDGGNVTVIDGIEGQCTSCCLLTAGCDE